MGPRAARLVAVAIVPAVVAVAAGCSVRRIDAGVYHSPKGYRVVIPGPEWAVVEDSRADLELQHRSGGAGMLANGTCGAAVRGGSAARLERQLTAGLRERAVVERGDGAVGGRPAARTVLDARSGADGAPMRIEIYTLTGDECVWDLIYAAPRERFGTWHGAFDRFVGSFGME